MLQPSDMPEMLIPLTSNRLIVFRHDLMKHSYRAAAERLVLQTWHMSGPFAPDPLGERIVILSAEIQGERLHIISLMTRLPGNSFGPLALLNVYAGGTDTVTRVPVERFCTTWRTSMKLWAWVSRTPATVRSVRRMSSTTFTLSSSGLEKTKHDSCHRLSASCWGRGMKRCSVLGSPELPSVGVTFQAEHSSIPSSTYQPFDEHICHLWHHYS